MQLDLVKNRDVHVLVHFVSAGGLTLSMCNLQIVSREQLVLRKAIVLLHETAYLAAARMCDIQFCHLSFLFVRLRIVSLICPWQIECL